jgi:hypothetical protein
VTAKHLASERLDLATAALRRILEIPPEAFGRDVAEWEHEAGIESCFNCASLRDSHPGVYCAEHTDSLRVVALYAWAFERNVKAMKTAADEALAQIGQMKT